MSYGFRAIELVTNYLLLEQEKYISIKKISISMLMEFSFLLSKLILLLIFATSPAVFLIYFSIVSLSEIMDFFMDIKVLMASLILIFSACYFRHQTSDHVETENLNSPSFSHYSDAERALHNFYFYSEFLQKIMSKVEEKFFSRLWESSGAGSPIFLTSLPRSGTTILLEILGASSVLASHTYRDMPFIFSPVLWSKLSSPFKKNSVEKERVHGDGLLVNEDSPEAFEEAIWLKLFPQKYSENKIHMWKNADASFKNYFHAYMKRIIFLRRPGSLNQGRYISKNNANISRIPVLKEMFPECVILVPIRDPFEHAISLHRQHINFLEKHKGDAFVKKYMADIGHFEFGELHRPIDFPELDALLADLKPENCDYWLAYWLACYRYLNGCQGLSFVSYEALCKNPEQGLANLFNYLNIEASSADIHCAASSLKAPLARQQDYVFSGNLSQQAQTLYEKLLEKSV